MHNHMDPENSLHLEPTDSRSPSIKFDSELPTRVATPCISRKCSQLLETPAGPEFRSWDEKISSKPSSISSTTEASSTPARLTIKIAGSRFTIAQHLGLGKWQRGLTVLGCFMLMFNSWGLVNAFGTYQSYYKQHLLPGWNNATLNLIGAMQCFVVLSSSMVIGRVLDAGHFYRLHVTGALLVTLASFLLSLRSITSAYQYVFLVQGFMMALGMSCMFVPSSQIVATWFTKNKTFFMGVVASGASIAGFVYPMMLKHLLALVGFHTAQRYVAIVTAVTGVVGAMFAIPNPDRTIRIPKRWMTIRTFVDTECFKRMPSLGLVIGICLLFTGFYAVFFNLEDWAADTGLGRMDDTPRTEDITLKHEVPHDAIRTFWLLSIMNGCSTIGRIGILFIGNFAGALRTHATVTIIAAILLLALWTNANTIAEGLAFVVLYGIISGADIALPPSSMADILGEDPEEKAKLGQWTGLMYACSAPFALAGPVLGGLLIGVGGHHYLPLQLWCGVALMLSGAAMAWASYHHYPMIGKLKAWQRQAKDAV